MDSLGRSSPRHHHASRRVDHHHRSHRGTYRSRYPSRKGSSRSAHDNRPRSLRSVIWLCAWASARCVRTSRSGKPRHVDTWRGGCPYGVPSLLRGYHDSAIIRSIVPRSRRVEPARPSHQRVLGRERYRPLRDRVENRSLREERLAGLRPLLEALRHRSLPARSDR